MRKFWSRRWKRSGPFSRRDGSKPARRRRISNDPPIHSRRALRVGARLGAAQNQLLLLSGSVQNPHDVVAWLRRIGRDPVLISHDERPVPLEEIDLRALPDSAFVQTKNFLGAVIGKHCARNWRRFLFSRRAAIASEEMAQSIASAISSAIRWRSRRKRRRWREEARQTVAQPASLIITAD